jgi:protein phosphatase
MERMRWESVSVSDRGLIRPNNEDAALESAEHGLFAVADGMGGHAAGEVASRMAVEALRSAGNGAPAENPAELLVRAFTAANLEIRRRGRSEPDKHGMGTTLTVLRFIPDTAGRGIIAHVGDSRAYRLRGRRMEQLTRDHTWVQERVDAGVLTPDQARSHPYASILTRVLGTDDVVDPDIVAVDTEPGDLFLLCSDGLPTMVADEEILRIVDRAGSLEEAARELVRAANSGGGEDNVTVVLFRLEQDQSALEETLVAPDGGAAAPGEEDELEDTLTGLPPVAPAAARSAEPEGEKPAHRRRRHGPWGRRLLWGALALGFVALVLGGALFGLSRAYFVGADEQGNVTVFQGVPFDLSDGVGLYRERYVSPLAAAQLSPEERTELFDHELTSFERAKARIRVFEAEALP